MALLPGDPAVCDATGPISGLLQATDLHPGSAFNFWTCARVSFIGFPGRGIGSKVKLLVQIFYFSLQ